MTPPHPGWYMGIVVALLLAGGCATTQPPSLPPTPVAAAISHPRGVAAGPDGSIYAGNIGNQLVIKITPPDAGGAGARGVVLAGTVGQSGSADGQGTAASFFGPIGLAVDSRGNVFVADSDNHTIRRISPDGAVTTFAGKAGEIGSADGPGSQARFSDPTCVAVDAQDNVYVSDNHNHTVRKITPAGVVSTLAGAPGQEGSTDGTGAAARFAGTRSVAVDKFGNVYVVCELSSTIRKITPAGVVTTVAGRLGIRGSQDGPAAQATFSQPRGLAVDAAGNIYVADTDNQVIRKIDTNGNVTTVAGKAGEAGALDGPGPDARFSGPRSVVVDAWGRVFIADTDNNRIRVLFDGRVSTYAQPANSSAAFQ